MSSVEERLQVRREPLDKWSLREQLCLASAVVRSGDQNWMSVSRALKPFGECNRPSDWFHQKNCAAQYGALLANVETPKRKKKSSGETVIETPAECILRQLLADRRAELKRLLAEEKAEYKKVQEHMKLLQAGRISEEQLEIWCKEIDEEESKREQEAITHAKWLKQRDLKKQEIERCWRPLKSTFAVVGGQKRKLSDDVMLENNDSSSQQFQQYPQQQQQQQKHIQYTTHQILELQPSQQVQEPVKPAFSPLLTSLLKSPSQVQNLAPVLHTAMANKSPTEPTSISSPTITNLINNISVDATLQNYNTNNHENNDEDASQQLDLLDDANLKIDDLAKSLVQDGPFPEIKKEEVDDIISEIIESAHDIVTDPEQHLQLDGNGDININLELEDEDELEEEKIEDVKEEKITAPPAVVDPFEFQEDPILFQSPVKPSALKQEGNIAAQYTPLYQQQQKLQQQTSAEETVDVIVDATDDKKNYSNVHGSVEIVEVIAEEQDNAKDLDKSQIQDIVHSTNDESQEFKREDVEEVKKEEPFHITDQKESGGDEECKTEPTYTDDLYDDNINMEVKIGKAKRDYSRTKKKEEKSFDMLLAIEKAQLDDMSMQDDIIENQRKESLSHSRILKAENERSTSPWTEEEDGGKGSKRRYSTPIDSLPNSPASSIIFDDDKEHRNWKKSVMLVYNRLASNKYASLFLKPITDEQAPGYSAVIHRPMDLQAIKKNIDNGTIRTSLEFKRDVMLMFTNAVMYNKTNGTIFNMALQMQQESLDPIEILLQADVLPSRRETRTSESHCKRKRLASDDPSKNKKKKDE